MAGFRYLVGNDLGRNRNPATISVCRIVDTEVPDDPTVQKPIDLSLGWENSEQTRVHAHHELARLRALRAMKVKSRDDKMHIIHLERIKMRTPYPQVVDRLAEICAGPVLQGLSKIVMDATGVGVAVVDMARERGLSVIGITSTSGESGKAKVQAVHGRIDALVPKKDLYESLRLYGQLGAIKIAKGIRDAASGKDMGAEYLAEVEKFISVKDAETGKERVDTQGDETHHHDLLSCVALPTWWHFGRRTVEIQFSR